MSNNKDSGIQGQKSAIQYIRNEEKADGIAFRTEGMSDNPFCGFVVNRFLNGNIKAKRWFKTEIVSLEQEWPNDEKAFRDCCLRMEALMASCLEKWKDKGYQATGAVHCNTAHPHFHVIVDTCSFKTGKQLSQDIKLMNEMKNFLSEVMGRLNLGEAVLQSKRIEEDEMIAEDDKSVERVFADESDNTESQSQVSMKDRLCGDQEVYTDAGKDNWALFNYPEAPFPAENEQLYVDGLETNWFTTPLVPQAVQQPMRVMCEKIDKQPEEPRVMCEKIDKQPETRRVMCTKIEKPPKELREMCSIIPKPKGYLK